MLATALEAAVRLWIEEFRSLSEEDRQRMIDEVVERFAERMEYLLHRKQGETAKAFNDVARAIALLSFCPGGIDCFGHHWKTRED